MKITIRDSGQESSFQADGTYDEVLVKAIGKPNEFDSPYLVVMYAFGGRHVYEPSEDGSVWVEVEPSRRHTLPLGNAAIVRITQTELELARDQRVQAFEDVEAAYAKFREDPTDDNRFFLGEAQQRLRVAVEGEEIALKGKA